MSPWRSASRSHNLLPSPPTSRSNARIDWSPTGYWFGRTPPHLRQYLASLTSKSFSISSMSKVSWKVCPTNLHTKLILFRLPCSSSLRLQYFNVPQVVHHCTIMFSSNSLDENNERYVMKGFLREKWIHYERQTISRGETWWVSRDMWRNLGRRNRIKLTSYCWGLLFPVTMKSLRSFSQTWPNKQHLFLKNRKVNDWHNDSLELTSTFLMTAPLVSVNKT